MSLARQRLFTLLFVPGVLAFAFILVACGSPQIQIQSPATNSSVACLGTPPTCPVNESTKWTGAILTAPTLYLGRHLCRLLRLWRCTACPPIRSITHACESEPVSPL